MTEPTQSTPSTESTARLATWGLILTVGGLTFMAWHMYQAILDAIDSQGGQPEISANELALGGAVAAAVGVCCLIAVVWRVAEPFGDRGKREIEETVAQPLDTD